MREIAKVRAMEYRQHGRTVTYVTRDTNTQLKKREVVRPKGESVEERRAA